MAAYFFWNSSPLPVGMRSRYPVLGAACRSGPAPDLSSRRVSGSVEAPFRQDLKVHAIGDERVVVFQGNGGVMPLNP